MKGICMFTLAPISSRPSLCRHPLAHASDRDREKDCTMQSLTIWFIKYVCLCLVLCYVEMTATVGATLNYS